MFEIRDLCENSMEVYLSCGCDPNDARITEEVRSAQKVKRAWAEKMIPKGLGAKLAFDRGYPAGFIEYIPIEVASAPVQGKQLLFISDIHCMTGSMGVYMDGEWGPAFPIEKGEMRILLQAALSGRCKAP